MRLREGKRRKGGVKEGLRLKEKRVRSTRRDGITRGQRRKEGKDLDGTETEEK